MSVDNPNFDIPKELKSPIRYLRPVVGRGRSLVLACLAGMVVLGCLGPDAPVDNGVINFPTHPVTIVTSSSCQPPPITPGEITFRPNTISIYENIAFVNIAEPLTFRFFPLSLSRINADSRFSLNLNSDITTMTFFIPGSFNNEQETNFALNVIEENIDDLSYRFCQEQGKPVGQKRFVVISIQDELIEIIQKNPSPSSLDDPFWRRALTTQLTSAYIARSQLNTTNILETPHVTPQLSVEMRVIMDAHGNPFVVERADFRRLLPSISQSTSVTI